MTVVLFFAVLLGAGLGGYAVLRALAVAPGEAWGAGRAAGLVAAVFPAWWAGCLGFSRWLEAAAATGAVLALAGAWRLVRDRGRLKGIAGAEAAFWAGALAVLWMRLPRPEIIDTEKFMDLGILATLSRAVSFPPPDMWLSGHVLPYYYWGSLVWVPPLKISGVPLEVGYNLVVAALGGVAAALAFVVGRKLGGSGSAGAAAAFFALFAGTPDGWRQLAAGHGISLWDSSRIVPDTITEFPLFTLWLGDLHPHLLSIPLALLAVLVALEAGRRGPRLGIVLVLAVLAGVTWAANPWAMPPTLAAVGVLLIAGDGVWRWPWEPGGSRWAWLLLCAMGGWVATAPFQVAFHPPFQGLGLVHAWTDLDRLALWGGALILPALAAAWMELVRVAGPDPWQRRGLTLGVAALLTVAAAALGRPVTVFLGAAVILLLSRALDAVPDGDRPALLLAGLGLFLLLVPEILYVRDPYGDQLHRMNTVFKSYIQAWPLLGLALPALLRRWIPGARRRAAVLACLVILVLPQTWAVLEAPLHGGSFGLDGLRWMDPGDRAAVTELRREPPGGVLAEAPGAAYCREGRLSAASGVPAVLGWENHERVWRGPGVGPELDRRRKALDRLYSAGDAAVVRRVASELGVSVVAVGEIERARYPEAGLAAVLEAGPHELEGGTVLVRMAGGGGGS